MSSRETPLWKKIALVLSIAVLLVGGAVVLGYTRFNIVPNVIHNLTVAPTTEPFPSIDESSLNEQQRKIVALLRQEYAAQPDGTKYAEGAIEPWCADFVSWIMKEAKVPLKNPNTGSWRIPGTYTLREYYESVGKFVGRYQRYQPEVGDVIMYDNPSPFGQHTNIVIKNEQGIVTTVGGNEAGKIRIQVHNDSRDKGLVGYGRLAL